MKFFNEQKYIQVLVFLLLLVLLASYTIYQIRLPAAEDLPRLIKNGEMIMSGDFDVITKNVYSYTKPLHPFANHHWLSAVVFYLLHISVGFAGIVLFKVLVVLSTFSILFYIATRKANFWIVALLSIPSILILIGRSSARPEIFSYLFIAIYLYLFYLFDKNPNTKKIYWLIPLQLLWTNMHLFFGVGILLIGGFIFERIIINFKNLRNDKATLKLSIIFVLMLITIFMTPYGIEGAINSLQVNTSYDAPIFSAETQSISVIKKIAPPIDNIVLVVFPIMVVVLGISFILRYIVKPSRKNISVFYFLASLATAFVGFKVIRSLPMFAIIFLVIAPYNFDIFFRNLKFKPLIDFVYLNKKRITYCLLILFTILIIYLIVPARKIIGPYAEFGLGLSPRSEDAGRFFKENGLKGPIFNDTDIGSYLIYYLYPEEKVFVDNRFGDAYPISFFKNVYKPMSADEESWKRLSEVYGINTIIFYQYDGGSGARDFLFRRIYDPAWAWVYVDDGVVILVKNIPENKTIIDKFRITKDNIKEKLRFLEESPRIDDNLSAADLYSLVGFYNEATNVYLKIVSEHPERGKIWMILGSIELTKSDQDNSNPALALVYLQRAIEAGWRTTESYSYLALAHYRLGNIEEAKQAVYKELKIDKDSLDAKSWMETLNNYESK